jgi:hypothetical protein
MRKLLLLAILIGAAGSGLLLLRAPEGQGVPDSSSEGTPTFAAKDASASTPRVVGHDAGSPCTEKGAKSGVPPEAVGATLIRGTVLVRRPEIGKPISRATIHVDGDTREQLTVKSDEEGRFQLTTDARQLRALRIEANGFMGVEMDLLSVLSSNRDDEKGIPVYLSPGYPVRGTVSANGKPLANARVRCVQRGIYNSADFGSSTVTDELGNFETVCTEDEVKILATHEEFRRGVTDWLSKSRTRAPVDLELERGVRLCGRALDEQGNPLPGARIDLDVPQQVVALHAWQESAVTLPAAVYSGADGMFSFEPLAGKLSVEAVAPDGARVKHDLQLAGTGEQFVELTVDSGAQVAGRVELDGKPLAGAMIGWECRGGRSPKPLILSSADGAFRLKQLPQGDNCILMARPPGESIFWNRPGVGGFLGSQVRVQPGDEAVLMGLRTETPGTVVIHFEGSRDGYRGAFVLAPVGDIREHTPPRETKVYWDQTTVTIPGLRAGTYRLHVDLSDASDPDPVDVTVVPGKTTNVTLPVPAPEIHPSRSGSKSDALAPSATANSSPGTK